MDVQELYFFDAQLLKCQAEGSSVVVAEKQSVAVREPAIGRISSLIAFFAAPHKRYVEEAKMNRSPSSKKEETHSSTTPAKPATNRKGYSRRFIADYTKQQ